MIGNTTETLTVAVAIVIANMLTMDTRIAITTARPTGKLNIGSSDNKGMLESTRVKDLALVTRGIGSSTGPDHPDPTVNTTSIRLRRLLPKKILFLRGKRKNTLPPLHQDLRLLPHQVDNLPPE